MKTDTDMTPINVVFMIIAFSPYLHMRFGYISAFAIFPILIYFVFKSYKFYLQVSKEKNISYIEALEIDLPAMSPIHFLFFFFMAAPIFMIFTGGDMISLSGIGILYVIYFIYYYGFKNR